MEKFYYLWGVTSIIVETFSRNKIDKGKIWKFVKLGKPQFALGLFFYFSLGSLLAILFNAEFVFSKFILGYAIIFLSTWAVHYHNDYFDFKADHFVTPTPISGGSGVLIEHPEWKIYSRNMAIFLILLAVAISELFTIIFSYSPTFILFVIIANLLAWFYAAPPLRLSYRGLGEFGNTAIGILFPGLGFFAMMGTLTWQFLIFSIPLLFFQFIFTISVEIPDMEGDKTGKKMTWIASRGRRFGFKLIVLAGLFAVVSFFLLSFTNIFPSVNFGVLVIISVIPLTLGILELIKNPVSKISATKYGVYNLMGILFTLILINFYFIYLILT